MEPPVAFENVRLGFDDQDILLGVTFHGLPRETLVLLG